MTSASFTLRAATSRDAFAVMEAQRAAVRGTAAGFYGHAIIEAWAPPSIAPALIDGVARTIASGTEIVVVAEDSSGLILGFGSIVPSSGELRAVYVRSAYGRQGIGRALLRELETLARQAGLKELHMDASINAEAFYRANGFRAEARGEHCLASGQSMACVHMRKTLKAPTGD